MAIFNWFGEQEHRTFNYHPMYYDEDEEKRRQMFGKVDGSDEKGKDGSKKSYTPGNYLRGAFRDGNYSKKRAAGGKIQNFAGIIGLVLIALMLIFFTKLYPYLF